MAIQVAVLALNNSYLCGINTNQIKTIMRFSELSTPPEMLGFIEGTINWQDQLVIVMDLNKRLGADSTEVMEDTKIVVTETVVGLLGFMANDVDRIVTINDENILDTPKALLNEGLDYFINVVRDNEDLVLVVDPNNLLSSNEQQLLT